MGRTTYVRNNSSRNRKKNLEDHFLVADKASFVLGTTENLEYDNRAAILPKSKGKQTLLGEIKRKT